MPTITVKDIPRRLHQELKTRAKAQHRSLNGEVIATLQASTEPTNARNVSELIESARSSRAKFSRTLTAKELRTWKNAGRS